MASRNGDTPQYLSLVGVNLPHVGYGKMVSGLRDALSTKVELCDDAERVVFALRPNLVKGWMQGQKPALLTCGKRTGCPHSSPNICICLTRWLSPRCIIGSCSHSSMTTCVLSL